MKDEPGSTVRGPLLTRSGTNGRSRTHFQLSPSVTRTLFHRRALSSAYAQAQLHMASALSLSSIAPLASDGRRRRRLWCSGESRPSGRGPRLSDGEGGAGSSRSENAVLRLAWYGSELLGIAASFFRPTPPALVEDLVGSDDGSRAVLGRAQVVEAIKEDYQRSYFVTGNLTLTAYEEDCEFADPAGSFRGLQRFKRNCTNFGSLLEKSNMELKKWEDFESQDKGIGHWRFSCIMSFPWRPILSATGYTEYYFDAESGKVCRHVEHWNVPKMALLKQILRPSRWVWEKR